MATKYAVASGLWSSTATWSDTDGGAGGATLPADNDAVVISANVSVQMDTDLSAYTGLQTVTIRGHATTPGMLYFKDGASGYLKIRDGYNLIGTNTTVLGRLLVNSDGVWGNTGALGISTKAVLSFGSTAKISTWLDIALYCTNPTTLYVRTYGTKYDFTASGSTVDVTNNTIDLGTTPPANNTAVMITTSGGTLPGGLTENVVYYVKNVSGNTCKLGFSSNNTSVVDITSTGSGTCTLFTGHTNTGTATMNVLDDITADAAWVTTTDHNRACLVNETNSTSPDVQRITLSTITSTTITLSANVDSVQLPGARIAITSRNVSIRWANNSSAPVYSFISCSSANAPSILYFQCEIVNTSASNTVGYGYAISSLAGPNCVFNGCITGFRVAINDETNDDSCSGIIIACDQGFSYPRMSISNLIVMGCFNFVMDTPQPNYIYDIEIYGCVGGYSVQEVSYIGTTIGATINGNIIGCYYAFYNVIDQTINSTIINCYKGILNCAKSTINSTIIGCAYALYNAFACNFSSSAIILGCDYGVYRGTRNIVKGEIIKCLYGVIGELESVISGAIGYKLNGDLAANVYDLRWPVTILEPTRTYFRGALIATPPSFDYRVPNNSATPNAFLLDGTGREGFYFEDYGRVIGASYSFLAWGDVLKNTTTVRPSGSGQSIEVVPNSGIEVVANTVNQSICIFEWTELSLGIATYTKSIYVKGEGWTTFPTSSELYFEAEYISNGTTLVTSTITSEQVLTDNTTWTQLSVSFTTAAVGHVRYRAYLKKYEAACKVYVDNMIV